MAQELPRQSLKQYIGDGVYADFDGFNVILTTENGIETTNRIVLEPEILSSFKRWEQWVIATLYKGKVRLT